MAVFEWILWISIIVALAFHVLYLLIVNLNMESKRQAILGMILSPECSNILQANGYTQKQAVDRVNAHYERWSRLSKDGKKEITVKSTGEKKTVESKWLFDGSFSPEKLAKMIIELLNLDGLTIRRKELNKRISQLPEHRQEKVLLQLESYLDMAEEDEAIDDTLDLEETKLNKEQELLEQRAKEIQERLAAKAKAKEAAKKPK